MVDAKAEAGAEAYIWKGETTAGFTVFGFDVDLTGSAGLGVAAKAETGLSGQSAEAGFKLGPIGLELNVTKA